MSPTEPVMTLYRMQSATGKSPFTPNIMELWAEPDRKGFVQFPPDAAERIAKSVPEGLCCATGFSDPAYFKVWFNANERRLLGALGYFPFMLVACRPVAQTRDEIFFVRRWPLHDAERIL